MFTQEEWDIFLEFFEVLTANSAQRGIEVTYSRKEGKVFFKNRTGKVIAHQNIREIVDILLSDKEKAKRRADSA